MTPAEKETWMRQRIRQLRNQLDEISGGEAMFGFPEEEGEGAPLEIELQFLEQVVGFETAAETTWRKKLRETGYEMPPPDSLNDEAVSLEVWQVIQRLAELQAHLDSTNHLSDRELYEKLYEHVDHPMMDVFMGEGAAYHFEMLAAGDEEDDLIWLRYFADEETRQRWHREFGIDLPPKEDPPYDRDQYLPQRVIPDSPILIFARRLAETAWDPVESPMRFTGTPHPQDLEEMVAVQLARTLLEVLGARGKATATAKGGLLPRAVVKKVFESQPFPPDRIERHHDILRTFDEDQYPRIYFVREACRQAGWLRKYAGAFQLTKKGARMLAADRAGELYLELLRAGFSKVNLAAFDGVDGWESLQHGLPVVLLRLWEEGEEWVPMKQAGYTYLLPEPYFEMLEKEGDEDRIAHILWLRLFRWLDDFGLIECAVHAPSVTRRHHPDVIRISSLGKRLLDFDRPQTPPLF
ncbi:MAG: hypothetical protein WD708_07185 [Kiritimatiellia bacterium]